MDKLEIEHRKQYTKKAWKELQKQQRATNGFNTGTREMKSNKYPSRQDLKREIEHYDND